MYVRDVIQLRRFSWQELVHQLHHAMLFLIIRRRPLRRRRHH